jgi:hypothetical protein
MQWFRDCKPAPEAAMLMKSRKGESGQMPQPQSKTRQFYVEWTRNVLAVRCKRRESRWMQIR